MAFPIRDTLGVVVVVVGLVAFFSSQVLQDRGQFLLIRELEMCLSLIQMPHGSVYVREGNEREAVKFPNGIDRYSLS